MISRRIREHRENNYIGVSFDSDNKILRIEASDMRFIYFENDSNLIRIFFFKNIKNTPYLISFFSYNTRDKILLKIIGKMCFKRINLLSKL